MIAVRKAAANDWPAIERLLANASLPCEGAREHLDAFLVASSGADLVGCIGAEIYGTHALLRSAAVAEAHRDRGIGRALVANLFENLRARHVESVALLTMTAERFFEREGFTITARESLAPALHASEELKGACPASATVMRRTL